MIRMTEKNRSGRRYTEEFRAEAVHVSNENRKSAPQAGEEISVKVNSLHAWVKHAGVDRAYDSNGTVPGTEFEEFRTYTPQREVRATYGARCSKKHGEVFREPKAIKLAVIHRQSAN